MLLSGFTFIRNAIKFDFPIRECVESMLPIVDELVINVGKSEDGTEDLMRQLQAANPSKIKLHFNTWDDQQTKDGLVLSVQTNLALAHCRGRWALYLQGDEALHESELRAIREAVEKADGLAVNDQPEAFELRYLHFYGGYSLIQQPWNWYPTEIRIIRRDSGAQSFGDAQTFRRSNGDKLSTQLLDAHVFHYGHARAPETMARKNHYFHRFWHGDGHGKKTNEAYPIDLRNLVWYWGTHPAVYAERIRLGVAWSPTPKSVIAPHWETVSVVYSKKDTKQVLLAETLARELRHRGHSVKLICSTFSWLKSVYTTWISRHRNALIDLNTTHRGILWFPCWAGDALFAYSLRIAHAPDGRLSKFRKTFFNSVHWGHHENKNGFAVPEAKWPEQLLKYLGL